MQLQFPISSLLFPARIFIIKKKKKKRIMQISAMLPDVLAVLPLAGVCRQSEGKHCGGPFFDAKGFLSPGLTRLPEAWKFPQEPRVKDVTTLRGARSNLWNWDYGNLNRLGLMWIFLVAFLVVKNCSFANSKLEVGPQKLRTRSFMARASGNSGGELIPMAPLQLESPIGLLLVQILQTHPHLLLATAEQQLENLQSQRDVQKEKAAPSSQDLLLYKRIAEMKEKERRKTLEEIIYCLVVQRFMENSITMIPKISTTSDPAGRVDFWPNQEQKLESVHSPEAFEMILSHLSLVLGERAVGPLDAIVQISKIKLGKLYAASIMYGYFLRRVDERYQLERSMNTLPEGFGEDEITFEEPVPEKQLWDPDSLIRIYPDDGDGGGIVEYRNEEKPYKLRSYVMYLDAETLQRYATIRSKEAISLIEKQTQALFGRPNIMVAEDGSLDASNDEVVSLTFSGLTMLVLEAVAFGSFLWDTENYVESKYPFINS